MVKIIILGNQETFENYKTALEKDCNFKVIRFTNNWREAFFLCSQLLPDLLLIDLDISDHEIIKTIKLMRKRHQSIKILIFSSFWNAKKIVIAIKNDVDGCFCKNISHEKKLSGIMSIIKGLKVIDTEIFKLIPNTLRYTNGASAALRDRCLPKHELTDRQLTILKLLAEGLKEEAIAVEVGLSINTIKYHKKQIFFKLDVECTSEALVKATKLNLLSTWSDSVFYVC